MNYIECLYLQMDTINTFLKTECCPNDCNACEYSTCLVESGELIKDCIKAKM